MKQNEAAALYRLMTWLSPSFPVGAFSYSSGIEWAVEAGDIVDAASLRDWLAAMLADGLGILRRRVSGARASGRVVARRCRAARHRGTCGGLRALARAPARDLGAGTRVHRHRARGMELRWARPTDFRLRRRDRLSRRGRPCQRRACDSARADHACLPSRADIELDIGRRAAGSARADRQPARAGVAGAGRRRDRARALAASLDDLGSATFRADLASLRHETQYTRLFRS